MNNTTCSQGTEEESSVEPLSPGQIVDAFYLSVVALVGTVGNLLVICSIVHAKRVHKRGNVFFINLAVADLMVCGIILPTGVANVVTRSNVVGYAGCQFMGYLLCTSCASSLSSLAFVALNRYWAIVHRPSYNIIFTKKNVYLMVGFIWLYSCILFACPLAGWGRIEYDEKTFYCTVDDGYSISFVVVAIIMVNCVPGAVITYCYWNLFKNVRDQGKLIRKCSNAVTRMQEEFRRRREINLVTTLAVTIATFVICWTPNAVIVIFFSSTVSSGVKIAATRLAGTNSALNFIIYGVMNHVFRKDYKAFIAYLFCCSSACKRSIDWQAGGNFSSYQPRKPSYRASESNRNAVPEQRDSFNPEINSSSHR